MEDMMCLHLSSKASNYITLHAAYRVIASVQHTRDTKPNTSAHRNNRKRHSRNNCFFKQSMLQVAQ